MAPPMGVACAGTSSAQLLQIFENTSLRGWSRAKSIQLIPIKLCPNIRGQLAAYLAANRAYHTLVRAVADDALIHAALSRTRYQPGHVLGVVQSDNALLVYVF